jgi:virulence-associated protein VapD
LPRRPLRKYEGEEYNPELGKMATQEKTRPRASNIPAVSHQDGRVSVERDADSERKLARAAYAIIFNLDAPTLEAIYPTSTWTDAYKDIAKFLRREGFDRQQGSVYFGNDNVDVVRCQMAVQKLTFEFDWFGPSVKDIRMLRIEDNNNLMPAIELAMQMKAK